MQRVGSTILAAAIAAGLAAAPASARVGVTSVTDGEPVGLPPAGTERILRVGIDVQANERVTTKADDRAHVVFLDGTALTVGPNSVLVIDKYVYDPDRKAGEMALSTTKGVFRFVGGAISKNTEVTIKTPSATIGIRGGIATVEVAEGGATKARLFYGDALRVTGLGTTQIATRAGSEITATSNTPPSTPAIRPAGRAGGPGANESFERPVGKPQGPPLQGLLNQNNVQQQQFQQQQQQAAQQPAPQQQPLQQQQPDGQQTATAPQRTPTTAPTTTTAGRPTAASIDEAFDKSTFAQKNSRVPPGQMKLAVNFNPQQGQRGQSQDGQGPPPRQATKAGGPQGQNTFKPPPVIAKPQQMNAVKNAVTNQGNIGRVNAFRPPTQPNKDKK
ncbi:MAG: FecR domain-containing protein [Reyranella sp.]|nr:FecR domain-containing protein [Reyranella sp.]MDP3163051.1 FecR domain-containing protein [Reyranella sp.]